MRVVRKAREDQEHEDWSKISMLVAKWGVAIFIASGLWTLFWRWIFGC
jgi:hypothetical protein